jgi:hypothetical protein
MTTDRVGEVDRAALAVGQPPVVHELEEDVPHVGVRLLDLVEQDDRVRAPADGLGELAALAVPDVAGRRADEPRDRVRLAELAHVDPDERVLRGEEALGQGLDELGLPHARRAEEQEGPERLVALAESDARAADRVGDGGHRGLLADDPAMQVVLERAEALELGGDELADRDPGAGADHRGDLGLVDHEGRALDLGRGRAEAVLELLELALELRGALEVLGRDGLGLGRLELGHALAQLLRGRAAAQADARGGLVDRSIALSGRRSS